MPLIASPGWLSSLYRDAEFQRQVAVAIVDNLLLGGVVLLLGLVANRWLERYKSAQALSREIASKRVSIAGEMWEKVFEYEKAAFANIVLLTNLFLAEMHDRNTPEVRSRP